MFNNAIQNLIIVKVCTIFSAIILISQYKVEVAFAHICTLIQGAIIFHICIYILCYLFKILNYLTINFICLHNLYNDIFDMHFYIGLIFRYAINILMLYINGVRIRICYPLIFIEPLSGNLN